MLWGRFGFTSSDLFRDPNGRFNTLVAEVYEANEELAVKLQQEVATALRHSLKRPRVSSGMLQRALLDRRNRVVDVDGFGVGVPSFLDESAAKYWEQIDVGSTVHLGQKLRGLWGDAITYHGAEYIRGDYTSQRDLVGQLSPFGPPQGQGFRPFRRADAARALRSQGWKGSAVSRTKGIIGQPIEPHEYFKQGWDALGGIRAVERAYDKAFRSVGLKVKWIDGKLYPSNRKAIGGR